MADPIGCVHRPEIFPRLAFSFFSLLFLDRFPFLPLVFLRLFFFGVDDFERLDDEDFFFGVVFLFVVFLRFEPVECQEK